MPYLNVTLYGFHQKAINCKCFFSSEFNYCPLIWCTIMGNKINSACTKFLQTTYNNGDLLKIYWKKDNSVSIHHENLHALETEMFKVFIKTSPEIMLEILPIKEQGQYNLRNQTHFVILCAKSVNYDTESIRGLEPKI